MSITPYNKYFTQNPLSNYRQLKAAEVLLTTAAIISYVALAAITTLVLLISYGNVGVLGIQAGWLLAGSVFISIASAIGGGYLLSLSKQYAQKSAIEYGVHQKLEEVKRWDETRVQAFLEEHSLKGQTPDPIDLRPLIARYQFFDCARQEKEGAAAALLQTLSQEPADIKLIARKNAWDLHLDALEQKINSAICLQILQQPFNCALDVIQEDGSIAQMLTFNRTTFYRNLYLDAYHEPNSAISFAADARRSAPLSKDAVTKANVDELRKQLFEPQPEDSFYTPPTTPMRN